MNKLIEQIENLNENDKKMIIDFFNDFIFFAQNDFSKENIERIINYLVDINFKS